MEKSEEQRRARTHLLLLVSNSHLGRPVVGCGRIQGFLHSCEDSSRSSAGGPPSHGTDMPSRDLAAHGRQAGTGRVLGLMLRPQPAKGSKSAPLFPQQNVGSHRVPPTKRVQTRCPPRPHCKTDSSGTHSPTLIPPSITRPRSHRHPSSASFPLRSSPPSYSPHSPSSFRISWCLHVS